MRKKEVYIVKVKTNGCITTVVTRAKSEQEARCINNAKYGCGSVQNVRKR